MSLWDSVTSIVGEAAPLIGTALGGPAGGAVAGLVANALGVDNEPDAILKAIESDPEALAKIKNLEQEHERELRSMTLQAETNRLSEINQTMRAELQSDNAFKSSWRPLFGYGAAIAWVGQIGAIIYVTMADPSNASEIIQALSSLTGMWGVALAVLGINVNARSKDKRAQQGQDATGMLEKLVDKVG